MSEFYVSGEYLSLHPKWHEQDAPWKTTQVVRSIRESRLTPASICDVGCGSGEILRLLSLEFPQSACSGFDVSPQAIALCTSKANPPKLSFNLGSPFSEAAKYDLALAIDVFEHVEDYLGFLAQMRGLSKWSIFHIPLDLTAQVLVRGTPLEHVRRSLGHLHYFTKDTALASLEHAGFKVESWFYTSGHTRPGRNLMTRLAAFPRLFAHALSPDFSVRLLGGYSLLALCRGEG
ncbi:class I SAM-dependent methyltransferase [Mesorhizobium sp. M0203]|uniref:class I SAM-dependent methyltransferase n=1 Tax=Mesorhizobium sp. M0203 TaxID=2956912 RepID=UPI00333D0CA6